MKSNLYGHERRRGKTEENGVDMRNAVWCLICCVGFAILSIAQPDDVVEGAAQPNSFHDFWAVSNSVSRAADWASVLDGRQSYFPGEGIEQARVLFDLMGLISTSKVEVICFKSSDIDANRGHLSFWITEDTVYKINHPVRFFLRSIHSPSLASHSRRVAAAMGC